MSVGSFAHPLATYDKTNTYMIYYRLHGTWSSLCGVKLKFHDADTDTDTDILATILAMMSVSVGVVECQLNGRATQSHGFESRPVRFHVTALGNLLTRMCLCHQAT